jgi:hypothetical protein
MREKLDYVPKPPRWRRAEFRPLGRLHRPRFHRYRPADPRPCFVLNRYPGSLIGVGIVLGGWCWSVKWARPAKYEPHPAAWCSQHACWAGSAACFEDRP